MLVLSQHVEQFYARELLADRLGGIGYLLKDRVLDAGHFVDAVRAVADGGTVMDPEVVSKMLASTSRHEPLAQLTERERQVLGVIAEGRSNAAIAEKFSLSESAVTKHTASIFTKLDLAPSEDSNRRVLAVLAHLDAARGS